MTGRGTQSNPFVFYAPELAQLRAIIREADSIYEQIHLEEEREAWRQDALRQIQKYLARDLSELLC